MAALATVEGAAPYATTVEGVVVGGVYLQTATREDRI
jgi:hypothetical protein